MPAQMHDNRTSSERREIGWPRTPHRLALGIPIHDESRRDELTRKVRRALRGKRTQIIVQDNFYVSGFCGIDE